MIQALKDSGLSRIVMRTGNGGRTAKALAERLGIAEFRAQVLPKDKADVVAGLEAEGSRVLMAGDGVKDVEVNLLAGSALMRCDPAAVFRDEFVARGIEWRRWLDARR